jgi:NADPH-dependent ferric siderophore reductase
LTAALAPIPAVRKLHVTPHSDTVVKAFIEVEDAAREQVSRAIFEAGLGLLSMHGQSTGLEAVFLQLSNTAATLPDTVRPAPLAGISA